MFNNEFYNVLFFSNDSMQLFQIVNLLLMNKYHYAKIFKIGKFFHAQALK